jgi:diguanylate cyclase (GGDEF)-like protein
VRLRQIRTSTARLRLTSIPTLLNPEPQPIVPVRHVRLLERNDTSLAVALVASTLVIFQRPLQFLIDAARDAEERYHIDLIPGLTVLVGAFAFHQYRKWQQAKAAARAAAAEAAQERSRSQELERLVAFGRALGSAIDPPALRQNLWRYLPLFAVEHEFWLLTRHGDRWERFLQDATAPGQQSAEVMEAAATKAMGHPGRVDPRGEGIDAGEDVCFPMVVGETTVGVMGIRNAPALTPGQRRALAAAAALVAIALRNVQLLAETRDNSLRDGLTGCFNRKHALESLDLEMRRARRTDRPLSLVILDIDNFKQINDQHGHLAGDTILAAVGRLLGRVLRVTDIKCRYGGDEFLVILPDTPLPGAKPVTESLLRGLSELRFPLESETVSISASAGLAVATPDQGSAIEFLARADEALYRAKRAGRNQFAVSGIESVAVAS